MSCQARNQWPKVIHRKWSHQSRLVEFGTLLIFKVIGQRSRSQGQIFRRGDTPRFALPLFCLINASKSKLYAGLHKVNHLSTLCLFKLVRLFCKLAIPIYMCVFVILPSKKKKYFMFGWTWEIEHKMYCLITWMSLWDSVPYFHSRVSNIFNMRQASCLKDEVLKFQ